MDVAETIWNDALGGAPASDLPGDVALHWVLLVHGCVMNGGVLNAVEVLDTQRLDAGQAGYTWLGLAEVADLMREVRVRVESGEIDDVEKAGALEVRADRRYCHFLPSDDDLMSAVRVRLASSPEAFLR